MYDVEEESRNAVLALETIESDDSALGLVDFGSDRPRQETAPTDARITAEALRPAAKGAAIGAVAAALIVGLSTMLLGAGDLADAAAVGGALFGAFVGGTWARSCASAGVAPIGSRSRRRSRPRLWSACTRTTPSRRVPRWS